MTQPGRLPGGFLYLGAPNLLSSELAPISEPDWAAARDRPRRADSAVVGILQHRAADEHQRTIEQLSSALNSRIVIEQAKGTIAERAGADPSDAFMRLGGTPATSG